MRVLVSIPNRYTLDKRAHLTNYYYLQVCAILVIETLHTVLNIVSAYLPLVKNFGKFDGFRIQRAR